MNRREWQQQDKKAHEYYMYFHDVHIWHFVSESNYVLTVSSCVKQNRLVHLIVFMC